MDDPHIVELTPDENRQAAALAMPLFVDHYRVALESTVAQARWLLATLAIINGGALVALLPVALPIWPKLTASGLFIAGLMSCLLAAHLGTQVFQRGVSKAFGALLGYWHSVTIDGERLQELEEQLTTDLERATRSRLINGLGFGSAFAFLAGCVTIGFGMLP